MDPQHLARLDDDGSVRRNSTGTAGGTSAGASPEGPEVPVPAPVLAARPTATVASRLDHMPDEWPLPVEPARPLLSDGWPLLDVDARQLAGAEPGDPAARAVPVAGALDAGALVAAMAARPGIPHRRSATRSRRRARYLAAALIGAAGVSATVAASGPPPAAQANEPVSVAEERGMVQAGRSELSDGEATARLREMVAGRAERADAQAAAAQAQAQADQAAADASAAAAAAAAEAARPRAVLPVPGARISSGFGYRWGTLHAGVDFAAPIGTPEYAVMDGLVVRAGAASGFGLVVYVQHANGDVTVYGHMQTILVAEGQKVQAGEAIALLGNRGQSTGPHLHFEVHLGGIDGEKVDPLPWLRANGVQV